MSKDIADAKYEFLSRIIDYAGLFPPASLSLEDALREYFQHQKHPMAWMLSHFICPAAKLPELSKLRGSLPIGDSRLSLSVLVGGGEDETSFLSALELGLRQVTEFCDLWKESARVDVFEVKLPVSGNLADSEIFLRFLEASSGIFQTHHSRVFSGGGPGLVFYELSPTPEFQKRSGLDIGLVFEEAIEPFVAVLSQTNANPSIGHTLGFKLRTGGVQAAHFPSVDIVATAVSAVAKYQVPFKATAGLHRPVRYFDDELGVDHYGFLNVFGACVLADAKGISKDRVREILLDKDMNNFSFSAGNSESHFAWKEHRATAEEVKSARRIATSFGSCSFEEPVGYLKKNHIALI